MGTHLVCLVFPSTTYQSEIPPTAASIAQQINDLSIPDVNATVETGKLKIISIGSTLVVSDPLDNGSMVRLGFTSNTITSNILDNIVDDINSILSLETNLVASIAFVDRLLISGDEFKVIISDVTGNSLDDLGISEGGIFNFGSSKFITSYI